LGEASSPDAIPFSDAISLMFRADQTIAPESPLFQKIDEEKVAELEKIFGS
jgi:hypothetical protein